MKITFSESEYSSVLDLAPETVEELAALFRMTNNSKAEKPEIYLSFGVNEDRKPYCIVEIKKLRPNSNKICNSVKNY